MNKSRSVMCLLLFSLFIDIEIDKTEIAKLRKINIILVRISSILSEFVDQDD